MNEDLVDRYAELESYGLLALADKVPETGFIQFVPYGVVDLTGTPAEKKMLFAGWKMEKGHTEASLLIGYDDLLVITVVKRNVSYCISPPWREWVSANPDNYQRTVKMVDAILGYLLKHHLYNGVNEPLPYVIHPVVGKATKWFQVSFDTWLIGLLPSVFETRYHTVQVDHTSSSLVIDLKPAIGLYPKGDEPDFRLTKTHIHMWSHPRVSIEIFNGVFEEILQRFESVKERGHNNQSELPRREKEPSVVGPDGDVSGEWIRWHVKKFGVSELAAFRSGLEQLASLHVKMAGVLARAITRTR